MKMITTTASLRKPDASTDSTLKPVAVGSGEIVTWPIAFPSRGW
jgi:hypothetical protein